MARKMSIAALVLLIVIAAFLVGGEWTVHRRSQETCNICRRHINPQAGVLVEIGGERRRVCCAHCAITEGLQEHKPVRMIEVKDYGTGRGLDPRTAWYVDGSRVMACQHDMVRMSDMKQAERMAFDRCSPGTFAFATRAEAETFVATNGGSILSLGELFAAFGATEVQQ